MMTSTSETNRADISLQDLEAIGIPKVHAEAAMKILGEMIGTSRRELTEALYVYRNSHHGKKLCFGKEDFENDHSGMKNKCLILNTLNGAVACRYDDPYEND